MRLKLERWIARHGGMQKVATDLGMQQQTIKVWLRGHGSPTSTACYQIIKMSKGYLSFKQIYEESTRNKK